MSATLGRVYSDLPRNLRKSKMVLTSGVTQLAGDVSAAGAMLKTSGIFDKLELKFMDVLIEGRWVQMRFEKGHEVEKEFAALKKLAVIFNKLGIGYSDKAFEWGAYRGSSRKYRYIAIGPRSKNFTGFGSFPELTYRSIKIKN